MLRVTYGWHKIFKHTVLRASSIELSNPPTRCLYNLRHINFRAGSSTLSQNVCSDQPQVRLCFSNNYFSSRTTIKTHIYVQQNIENNNSHFYFQDAGLPGCFDVETSNFAVATFIIERCWTTEQSQYLRGLEL